MAATKKLSLKDWINEVGVDDIAKLLKISSSNVRHWRRGSNLPSDEMKQRIKRFSKGAVSYDEMIETFFKQNPRK